MGMGICDSERFLPTQRFGKEVGKSFVEKFMTYKYIYINLYTYRLYILGYNEVKRRRDLRSSIKQKGKEKKKVRKKRNESIYKCRKWEHFPESGYYENCTGEKIKRQ